MAAAEKLGIEPMRILHVGDDPERDVWGAKQAGMKALLLRYEVPESFKTYPGSLLALGRGTRSIRDSEIQPDGQVNSLKEALEFIDSHCP
jgi:FMN phosphatase YigB (HAD superfamily)